jgi:DNA-3-methyladenine glycosylase II
MTVTPPTQAPTVAATIAESRHFAAGELPARAPFDFAQSLAFVEEFAPVRGEQRLAEGTLTKALRLGGHTIVFALHAAGTVERPAVAYRLWSAEPLPDDVLQAALERISFFLSLNDDLTPFYAIAREDAAFAPIVE